MTRDELIEAGVAAMSQSLSERARVVWVTRILDVVEPLIRDDEREKIKAEYLPVLMEHLRILSDLRAGVMGLPDEHHYGKDRGGCIDRAAVLALLDGSVG